METKVTGRKKGSEMINVVKADGNEVQDWGGGGS